MVAVGCCEYQRELADSLRGSSNLLRHASWNGIRNTGAFVPSSLHLDKNVEAQRRLNTSPLSTLNKQSCSAEVFKVGVSLSRRRTRP